jgi:UDP-glucose 4-epimerase
MGQHILITGGAGFIGSHLAEHLLNRGDEVTVIDDLSTGSIDNIRPLKSHPRFHYVIESIMRVPLLAELVDDCDAIYHLAASVGVKLIVDAPVRTIETNIRGTEIVLSLANKKNKKVLITSTSEIYGKRTQIPFHEDDDLQIGPTTKHRWAYACSKAIDEFLALAYWKEKKLPVVIVRVFNTIGPRQTGQYGMVVPTFVRQALSNRPITVYGSGLQRRSFTYVEDTVRAMMALMDEEKAVGQVFNIGSREEVTILQLARKIKAMTGSRSPIKFIPYAKAYEAGFEDMERRLPDIHKLGRMIGYRPRWTLDAMLRSIIAWTQNNPG